MPDYFLLNEEVLLKSYNSEVRELSVMKLFIFYLILLF